MSLWLDDDELTMRTGYKQNRKRCEELARQRVRFTTRRDGFPLVERSQFELMAGKAKREPNFGAFDKKAG
jgi:hypothetical protein